MSTIIKATAATAVSAAFNFEDVASEAHRVLDRAHGEAAQIIADAQQEAETIRRAAQAEGQQAALAAVDEILADKVAAHVDTLRPALEQTAEEIRHLRDSWLAQWEKSAVHVAAAIAERVIRRAVEREPQITLGLITEALELAAGSPEIRILLNPHDRETLGDAAEKLAADVSRLAPAEIVADESVSRGGCRIETRHGVIDETFEAQLQRIEEELN